MNARTYPWISVSLGAVFLLLGGFHDFRDEEILRGGAVTEGRVASRYTTTSRNRVSGYRDVVEYSVSGQPHRKDFDVSESDYAARPPGSPVQVRDLVFDPSQAMLGDSLTMLLRRRIRL